MSAAWKADYANCRALRGAMFWELSGDDPAGSLLTGLSTRLRNASSTCRNAWLPFL
jgi:GH18 family chitinase